MNYRVVHHPNVDGDLRAIKDWLLRFSDPGTPALRLAQIAESFTFLSRYPNVGTVRNEVAPGLRVVPSADRHAAVAFVVSDETREVLIIAVTYGGADWIARSRVRLATVQSMN